MCDVCNWSTVLESIEAALSQSKEVPRKGAEFADSVVAKLTSIKEWIAANEHVTGPQELAVANMGRGIRAWIAQAKRSEGLAGDEFDGD